MTNAFTLSDLHRYEQELAESEEIEHPAAGPSRLTLMNIMNYSRALSVLKTKIAGNFEFLMN